MARRNRRGRDRPRGDLSRILDTGTRTETYAGGSWTVRSLRGNTEERTYVCPGCQQQLSSGQPHVVVWPADGLGGIGERRHWHTPCWQARDRRPPRGSWK